MMKFAKEISGSLAALALLAGGALAQTATARPAQTPTQVVLKDSAGRVMIIRANSLIIDSLIRKLNNLPLGSPEALAIDSMINVEITQTRRPTTAGTVVGEFHFDVSEPRAIFKFSPTDVVPQGTLGFTADAYNRRWYSGVGQYVQYFEYPMIVAIEANSPASRAGVRFGDSVLAYNGLDLRRQAINLTQLLTPGRDVSVRLRRDGESRDVIVTVDKAPERLLAERRAEATDLMASENRRIFEERVVAARAGTGIPTPQGGFGSAATLAPSKAPVAVGAVGTATARTAAPGYAPSPNGMLGAAMADVDPGLAAAIRGMEGKRGVLVTVVPEGSFAFRTGLRPGDVILKAEDADVATVAQLRVRLYLADQTAEKVRLTILRAGKTHEVTYTPR